MNILVTGGAGFIGSHITDAFIEEGHSVIVIDDLSSGKKENIHPKAKFIPQNICDTSLEVVFEEYNIQAICHQAAQINVRSSVKDPVYDATINILGTLNILECAKKFKIHKFIFASSGGAIYGDTEDLPTPENHYPYQPASPYGIAKLSVEYYLDFYHQVHGLQYVALRYANVYGPRQDPHGEAGVVAIFCQKMLSGEQAVINGDGEQIRDFVFVKDVARANLLSLNKEVNGAINIGTGMGTSVNTLYMKLKKLTKSTFDEEHAPQKAGEQRKSIVMNQKAQELLSWQPLTNIDAGLAQTVDFFRQ